MDRRLVQSLETGCGLWDRGGISQEKETEKGAFAPQTPWTHLGEYDAHFKKGLAAKQMDNNLAPSQEEPRFFSISWNPKSAWDQGSSHPLGT